MVEVVSARTQLRRASGARYTGRCPFHEERTPSLLGQPGRQALLLLRLREGRRHHLVRPETENLDFVGAIEWLAERFRVPLEYEETSPQPRRRAGGASGSTRCSSRRRRSSSGYLWEAEAGAPVREYLAERGLGEEIAEGVPARALPGRGLAAKARESGLHARRAARRRAREPARQRLLPAAPHVPARRRARPRASASRRASCATTTRSRASTSTRPRASSSTRATILYGLHLARPAIAKQDRAVVVEGNTDVIALRQAGFEPVVASMGTALTERQLRELGAARRSGSSSASTPTRPGRRRRCAGWSSRSAQGFDVRVVTLPPGPGSGRRARRRSRSGSGRPRATSSTACGSRSSARPTGRRRSCGRARCSRRVEDSPERQEALRLLADRLDLPRETLAGLAPARSARRCVGRGGETPRLLEAGDPARARRCSPPCVAQPVARPRARGAHARALRLEPLHRRFRDVARRQRRRTRSSSRCAPSSTRAPRGRRSTSGPGRSSSSGSASGS